MRTVRAAIAFAVCVGAAAPAVAFEQMTLTACRASVDQIYATFSPEDEDRPSAVAAVEAQDGWCRIAGTEFGSTEGEVDWIEWRMEDTALWTVDAIPPLALDLRFLGVDPDRRSRGPDTDRPDLTARATLRQQPDAGQVILERYEVENGAGDKMSASAVFERVFLTSPSMMQVSLGSATFKAGIFSMTFEGTQANPFGLNFDIDVQGNDQAQSQGAFDLISRLPEGVVDDASRAELMAFAGDLPRPVGTIEVSIASERGLGLMQVGASAMSLMQTALDGGSEMDARQLDVMLDGLTVRADWTSAAQVAQ